MSRLTTAPLHASRTVFSRDVTSEAPLDGRPSYDLPVLRKAVVVVAVAGCAACVVGSGGSNGLGAVSIGISELFVEIALVSAVAALLGAIWGTVRWKGGWRVAAAVPLAALALWGVNDAYDLANDPTSHNLLPLEFALGALVAAPYMLVIWLWRRLMLKRT
jgi:hypothetical protein